MEDTFFPQRRRQIDDVPGERAGAAEGCQQTSRSIADFRAGIAASSRRPTGIITKVFARDADPRRSHPGGEALQRLIKAAHDHDFRFRVGSLIDCAAD